MTCRFSWLLGLAAALAPISPAVAQEVPGTPDTGQGVRDTVRIPATPLVSRGIYLTREFRNPTFAAVASMGFPGGGQVYNDDIARFLLAAGGLGGSAGLFLGTQDTTLRILSGATFSLVWLWSISDAYLSAATYNHLLEQQALQ